MKLFMSVLVILCGLTSCRPLPTDSPIKIATNPWPGYEFLHLAKQQGFFKANGLNVELLELTSLNDAQFAYINRSADGFTSTLVEAVKAPIMGGKPLKIIMLPDYSNGGDMIIASEQFKSLAELKGKRIGCEVSSLGLYFLARALEVEGLSLDDVEVVNIEQSTTMVDLSDNRLDAVVTYTPFSIKILKQPGFHTVFSSADIPNEILDTISFSEEILQQHPGLADKMHKTWEMTLDFVSRNPQKSYSYMAKRHGVSVTDYQEALKDVVVLNSQQQRHILQNKVEFAAKTKQVCKTLTYARAFDIDCDNLPILAADFNQVETSNGQ